MGDVQCYNWYIKLLCLQRLSYSTASVKVQQILNTTVSASFDVLDIVHTIVFPEGRILGVTVEYDLIAAVSSNVTEVNLKNVTIEEIEVNPFTDANE